MKRIEAEQHIRGTKRWCRGHWKLSAADRRALHEQWQTIRATNVIEDALAFKCACEIALKTYDAQPVGDLTWDFVERRVAELIFSCNEDCGFDVNDLILAHPLDGVEREAPCPKCGQTHTFSSFYELED